MSERLEDFALSQKIQHKDSLKKVGLVGCGSMGQEITRLVSQNGIDVLFIDLSEARIKEIMEAIGRQLDQVINKWGLTLSEKKAILSRIKGSTNFNDLKDCDIVIETINSKKPGSNLEVRKEVFRKVEAVVPEDTVITSNTSTLMISDLASVLSHPERAVGLHFLTPASEVKVVEVVRGYQTSDVAYDYVVRFARMLDKRPVVIQESPGNVSTRLIVTLINEACETLMEGVASVRCIDETMKLGFGLQFGPFEMADRIGLNKVLKWMDNLYAEYGTPQFKASPILKRLVRANYLGKSNGRGFYTYDAQGKATGTGIRYAEIV
jgi:3-hydroxybutyryl-CoA dehydrogenase